MQGQEPVRRPGSCVSLITDRPRIIDARQDISSPIARDDRVHIKYVPTQVVTEFLRTAKLPEGVKLDGIRYRSSRRDGGISLVLFADRRNVADASDDTSPEPDPWLKLAGRSERVVP
jgi:hypothetical protein